MKQVVKGILKKYMKYTYWQIFTTITGKKNLWKLYSVHFCIRVHMTKVCWNIEEERFQRKRYITVVVCY